MGIMVFATYESYALNALEINYPSVAHLERLKLISVKVDKVDQKLQLAAQKNKRKKM